VQDDIANPASGRRFADVLAGLIILAGSALAVVLFMNHPEIRVGGTHSPTDLAAAFTSIAAQMQMVHGGLAVIFCFQTVALARFSQRLGLDRLSVLAGLGFFAIGTVFLILGAILEGFAAGNLAAQCASVAQPCNAALPGLLKVLFAILDSVTKVWMAAYAIAIASWALALLTGRGAERVVGLLGVIACAAPVAMFVVPGLENSEPAFMSVFAILGLWLLSVAAMLIVRRAW
jgi:hypothetical protein